MGLFKLEEVDLLDYYRTRFVKEAGICVVLKPGESLSDLLRRFKKKFMKSGLSIEIRNRNFFEKPSIKKKRKQVLAERRRKREEEGPNKTILRKRKQRRKQ